MDKSKFNQWQDHLAKELNKNYIKLKLIKTDERNIRTVSRKKS
jgi:hypothetical protein